MLSKAEGRIWEFTLSHWIYTPVIAIGRRSFQQRPHA